MQENKINVAVIGTGNMGRHHIRNYFEIEESNLVAICDIDPKKQKLSKKFKCKFYKNYKRMLLKEKIDALSIAVPTNAHEKIALYVLKRGIHVLVEKPIASTETGAKKMITLAKRSNSLLAVGHIERFNPGVKKMQELIKKGALGKIISIIAKRVGPFAPRIKEAGVLIDLAVHDIDIISYLFGQKPSHVYVNGGNAINRKIEDYAEMFLKFGSSSGYIQVNWITPVIIRELHVTGTGGYARLNYITQELDFYKSHYKEDFDDYGDFVIQFGISKKKSVPIKTEEPLRLELKSFLSNVQNKTKPEVTGEQGLQALSVALKALKNVKYAKAGQ